MKRTILLLPMLFAAVIAWAQESVKEKKDTVKVMEVTDFYDTHELTANQTKFKKSDQNGEVAAIIKVQTFEKGFLFDNSSMGVVDVVEKDEMGEIWVYVPHGIIDLTIKHPAYGVLIDWPIPVEIREASTYCMKLKLPDLPQDSRVGIQLYPDSASLQVDSKTVSTDDGGFYSASIAPGAHSFKASLQGFHTKEGKFYIRQNDFKMIKCELQPITCQVFISCRTKGCDIYIDGDREGLDSCRIDLPIGHDYEITVSKEGYFRYIQTISVMNDSSVMTVEIPALKKVADAWDSKSATFISAVISGPLPISYGVFAGWCARVGGYAKARTNFNFTSTDITVTPEGLLPDGTIFPASGNKGTSYFVATGGLMVKAIPWLYFYAGAGYSSYSELWETADGNWAKVTTTAGSSVAADIGAIFKIKHLTVSLGATYAAPKAIEAEIGVGVAF